jgi:hypothetical protein
MVHVGEFSNLIRDLLLVPEYQYERFRLLSPGQQSSLLFWFRDLLDDRIAAAREISGFRVTVQKNFASRLYSVRQSFNCDNDGRQELGIRLIVERSEKSIDDAERQSVL